LHVAVYSIDRYEMDFILKKSGSDSMADRTSGENSDAVVRLRGLPFGCTKEEIATFFLGMQLSSYPLRYSLPSPEYSFQAYNFLFLNIVFFVYKLSELLSLDFFCGKK